MTMSKLYTRNGHANVKRDCDGLATAVFIQEIDAQLLREMRPELLQELQRDAAAAAAAAVQTSARTPAPPATMPATPPAPPLTDAERTRHAAREAVALARKIGALGSDRDEPDDDAAGSGEAPSASEAVRLARAAGLVR